MQEEVTQRTVALCVEATRLSAGMLQQAMKKVLDEMQKGVTGHKTKLHHGKQTLRQLMKHNTGVSNIEITDQNIRAFSATAKKYGIDFALKKDTSGEIPRYLVFFKGRDADVITAAFREFSAKNLEKEKKPSIRKELDQCTDSKLYVAMNLAFACSLRMGEILGLTWNNVHISDEEIADDNAYVYIDKELARASKRAIEMLGHRDVYYVFPPLFANTST